MMVDLFHIIEDAFAITYMGGIYRQAKLFRRGEHIYAAHGGGYVRLLGANGTTHPRLRWQEIETTDNQLAIPAPGGYAPPKWIAK